MAIAFDRKLGENATPSNPASPSVVCDLTAGEFAVIWVACDNNSTTDPTVSDVTFNGTS